MIKQIIPFYLLLRVLFPVSVYHIQAICSQAGVSSITAAQYSGKTLREEDLLDLDRERLRRRPLLLFSTKRKL